MKILFLGTPGFAVPSLDILVRSGYEVVAVITAPDKPAGRGQKLHESEIKKYALSKNIPVLQPVKLSDALFLEEVKSFQADLQIVVAFRMMPEALWSMPRFGTFNLHGSLLPQYRGAAPINRVMMNGEKETGVTTFFLQHEIDAGNIIYRQTIPISENENAGELHDRMMMIGAELVLKTVQSIEKGEVILHKQEEFIAANEVLKPAPKIFVDDRKINFSASVENIHNQVRGLSPTPGAFFEMQTEEGIVAFKVFKSLPEIADVTSHRILETDGKSFVKISAANGWLNLLEVQFPGKKRMEIKELLRGFQFKEQWKIL